jgi:glycosyltransferase involved in cell wall biosynthesis
VPAQHTARDAGLRVALVSPHPPSRVTLNEYGYHLLRALVGRDEIAEVVLLHDDIDGQLTVPDKVTTRAAWRFNSLANPFRLLRELRRTKPDVAMINLQFASFGDSKVAAGMGLLTPILCRMFRIPTVTILHNITETVDLDQAGYGGSKLAQRAYRLIGETLTKLILRSDRVVVLVPRFASILREKYGASNVYLVPHGIFEAGLEEPSTSDDPPVPTIMAFGKFGTYKRIEPLIGAFRTLREGGMPDLQLVIAGSDSPNSKGYLKSVEQSQPDLDGITFTGYVAEEDVPKVFRGSTVVAFPYVATTGSSGPLHQATAYGRAVVLPAIGDFIDVVGEEGFAAETFEPDDEVDLTRAIRVVLTDDTARHEMAQQNLQAAEAQRLGRLAGWYVLHFVDVIDKYPGARLARIRASFASRAAATTTATTETPALEPVR